MSTPGRRRALKALAAAKHRNQVRVDRGQKPLVKDPKTGELKPTTARALGIKKRSSA
jgi:hypothetical protein